MQTNFNQNMIFLYIYKECHQLGRQHSLYGTLCSLNSNFLKMVKAYLFTYISAGNFFEVFFRMLQKQKDAPCDTECKMLNDTITSV